MQDSISLITSLPKKSIMETLLQQLNDKQLLYILERFRMEYFQAKTTDIPTIKTRKSNIDFAIIQETLWLVAQSSPDYAQSIKKFALESQDSTRLHQVVTMGHIGRGIRITSLSLVKMLINPLIKVKYVLEKGLDPTEQHDVLQALKKPTERLSTEIIEAEEAWRKEERQHLQDPIKDPVSIVIFTPKIVEFKAVIRLLKNITVVKHPPTGTYYDIGYFNQLRIAVRETGATNPNMAAETERAIGFFQPKVAILVGMAGGFSDKLTIGDIVVGSRSYSYESGVETDEEFQNRQRVGNYNYSLVELAKRIRRQEPATWPKFTQHHKIYNVEVGTIAAGDKVIETKKTEIYELIKRNCEDALAVDMEAVGFSASLLAYQQQVKGITVRSISDLLDEKRAANKKGSRELASENAAAFAFELLRILK